MFSVPRLKAVRQRNQWVANHFSGAAMPKLNRNVPKLCRHGRGQAFFVLHLSVSVIAYRLTSREALSRFTQRLASTDFATVEPSENVNDAKNRFTCDGFFG